MHCLSGLSGAARRTVSALIVAALFYAYAEPTANAAPAYPPRATCAVAVALSDSGLRIAGTGFTPGRGVALRIDSSTIGHEAVGTSGSFRFGLTLASTGAAHHVLAASDGLCMASASFTRPGAGNTPPPEVQPPSAVTRIPGMQLGPTLFLTVLATLAGAAIALIVVASRVGHRKSGG
jgi:hypothetical protein